MEMTKIKGQRRPSGGRHANERLRRAGMLPAVIYGHKQEPEHVALPKRDIEFALQAQAHVLELTLDGVKPQPLLIKEVQYDHLYRDPIHLDLMRVDPNERVKVSIPLHFIGTPKGVAEGGEMVTLISDLDVEAPVLAIPEEIRVNVADIGLGGHLYVKDLTLPQGVTPAVDKEEQVCLVRTKREVTEAAPAVEGEAPTGPEVIAKGKIDEEGGEGAKEAPKK